MTPPPQPTQQCDIENQCQHFCVYKQIVCPVYIRSHPYNPQAERYRPVCYPDCENEKRIRRDEQEKVLEYLDELISEDLRKNTHNPQAERDTSIICLCGSTKFTRQMLIKQWELTKQGYIVVSWCALPDDYISYQGNEKAHIGDIENVKAFVDEIHKRKIDISDEVLVIDIGGYVGESTRSEINYAIKHGKPIRYLSEELRQQGKEEQGCQKL